MRKEKFVDVYSDRPYYIMEYIDGNFNIKELQTNNLTNIIITLKEIENMKPQDIIMAACYKQYEGSFNVIVDKNEQYQKIYDYANLNYKTFKQKMCGI